MPLGGGTTCMERIDEEENAVMDEMNIFQPRAPFSGMHDDMEVNEVSLDVSKQAVVNEHDVGTTDSLVDIEIGNEQSIAKDPRENNQSNGTRSNGPSRSQNRAASLVSGLRSVLPNQNSVTGYRERVVNSKPFAGIKSVCNRVFALILVLIASALTGLAIGGIFTMWCRVESKRRATLDFGLGSSEESDRCTTFEMFAVYWLAFLISTASLIIIYGWCRRQCYRQNSYADVSCQTI
ncbi:hypothetical protein DdX_10424 [Ditylenchus destructor]|uniref:Uncharacterized protein n=1 Tax=Ditylenchus destructor TaxID=166010 RepID=A0AAD4N1B2_9BILA|nr:hypothetical protein DdX_10424 [Ditylenchus destructor]